MIDPADLNDPAKAEAFVREAIDDLAANIARLEAEADEQVRDYTSRHGDDFIAVSEYRRTVQLRLHLQTEPLRIHRENLVRTIARVEACRKADT